MATKQKKVAEPLDSVEQRNKENGALVGGEGVALPEDINRKEGETAQEYNERVPVALQPVLEGPKLSYLGNKL